MTKWFGSIGRWLGRVLGGGAPRSDRSAVSTEPDATAEHVALYSLSVAVLVGVAGINVYASQFSRHEWTAVASTGFLVAGAALGVGGFLGFLFGIPRYLQGGRAPDDQSAQYQHNTNLEQISDWLTKILVGVGLTQVAQLPNLGQRLTDFLSPGLGGGDGAAVFAAALLVYYSICGFLLGYLWTSLFLAAAYRGRDRQSEWRLSFAENFQQAVTTSPIAISHQSQSQVIARAERVEPQARSGHLLWVDDHPQNNDAERRALEQLGLTVDVARTTAEAMDRVRNADQRNDPYDVIISDRGREGKANEGEEFLRQLRDEKHVVPVIFYTGQVDQSTTIPATALGITNRPDELLHLVFDALERRR